MKIVNIVPGFGGSFYCGNCLRDSVFVKTLKVIGHEAIMLPVYLPLTLNTNQETNDIPVFYGAVNIYLKQQFKFMRNMPKWMHHFFDSAPILRYAAKKSGSTRADGLEEMTISMLKGAEGLQAEELDQLINYLKHHEKPDIVHLSNSLLLGMAAKIKEELNIPVVCSLQDEDVWIDAMTPDYRVKLWNLMAEKVRDVNAFIAVSHYFADVMKNKMHIPDNKIFVVPIGVDPEQYDVFSPSLNPLVIGYISRLCEENGLEVLIDAFIELKDNSVHKNAKLRLTGGKTGDDKAFINKQIKKLKKKGYFEDVEWQDDFSLNSRSSFFQGLTVVSVPVLKGEAFGLYQLESMASGIPVLQPALGAFPEIAESTCGGAIYEPNTPIVLASALVNLFSDPVKLQKMSEAGRKAVMATYNARILAGKMVEVYEKIQLNR